MMLLWLANNGENVIQLQNCDIEGKNSKCEFFYVIIWK